MHDITFEQFLQHTNAEEIVVSKMKESGPRIYRINYDRRFKFCKVLYERFYDVELRETVFKYGLVLKPMPNSLKAKFLQFPEKNNNEDHITTTMQDITFEQFLHHTNAEEIVVSKMKEAGPRIYRINYDKRIKYCKVLYKKFYDVKLRETVFKYGLVLKPMPNSFKAKFLQFPEKNNNNDDYNSSVTTENTSEPLENIIQTKLPLLEEKYKNDLPSTSSGFRHKPRIISQSKKSKTKTKINSKSDSPQQKPNLKRDITSSKLTFKIPNKSVPKRLKSLEKQKFSKESPKITNYFTNSLNINVDEEMNLEQIQKLRKRISDPQNEEIEIEPQSKRPKISPAKKTETKSEPEIKKNKIGPKSSKTNLKTKNNKDKMKKNKTECDGKKNSTSKESTTKCRMRLYSDEFDSDDCDINTNNSIVNLISEDSRPQAGPERKFENNSSPAKSALPKRNRTEDYGRTSNSISKKILEEKSPKKSQTGYTKNEIELWMTEGQKALQQDNEENNKSSCTEVRPDKHISFKEDVFVSNKLQTLKTHPDKVKKYIKYWLKLEIQIRKGINLEATVVSETTRVKLLSAFEKMTYEDYKNLLNVKEELEENIMNDYTAFIRNEKPWPAVHIELEKLQLFLHSKGIKGSISLKNIPPRILSFDEVLEKTNIKECISLNCSKPPESYKELLSLCKKEYEKCCCEGIWTEELKFNDKKEESGSSQEMSIELFTEPLMPMSPVNVNIDSGNIQQNATQKELPILQNLNNNSSSSSNATKDALKNEQNESGDSTNSTKPTSTNPKKSGTYGPKSRRKHSSKTHDELEVLINHICGDDEQEALKKTTEPMVPIDTQELNRILTHSETQPSSNNRKENPLSERRNSADPAVCTKSATESEGIPHSERRSPADITKSLKKVATSPIQRKSGGPKSRRKHSSKTDDELEVLINHICGDDEQHALKKTTEPIVPTDTQELNRILAHSETQPTSDNRKETPLSERRNSADTAVCTKSATDSEGILHSDRRSPADITKSLKKVATSTIQRKSGGPKSRRKHSTKIDDELEVLINHICGDDDQQQLKKPTEPMVPIDTQELNRILAHSETQPSSDNRKETSLSERRNSPDTAICTKSTTGSEGVARSERRNSEDIAVYTESITNSLKKVANQKDISEQPLVNTKNRSDIVSPPPGDLIPLSQNIFGCTDETNTKCFNIQIATNTFKTPPKLVSQEPTLPSSEMDGFISTTKDESTVKHAKATGKDNPIPLSPNLFQSSEESNTKCDDSQLIEVQTQESVYVNCELNNDFNTEQNNFSISMREASESEDPFGETIVTLDETVVIKLDPSQNKTDGNAQIPLVDLSMPEKSTSVAENLDSIDSEIAVSSDGQKTHLGELNVSKESTSSIAVNFDSNEVADKTTENTVDSEETIVLKKLLLSCPSVSEEFLETTSNQTQKKDLCSTVQLSNPSNENIDIGDGIASTLGQAETANKEKENSVIRAHRDVAVNLAETLKTSTEDSNNKNTKKSPTRAQSIQKTLDPNALEANLGKTKNVSTKLPYINTLNTETVSVDAKNQEKESSVARAKLIEPTLDVVNDSSVNLAKTKENCRATCLKPALYLNTDEVNSSESANNKAKKNLVKKSIEPTLDANDVAKTFQTQNKTLPEGNIKSKQPERRNEKELNAETSPKVTSDVETASNKKTKGNVKNLETDLIPSVSGQAMKDVKVVVKRVSPDHKTVSNKNTKKNTENIETDLDSSLSAQPIKDLKVVVKREIFSQSFSQYDDDVQIIEIPKSEAMVIEDEETAPELLEALLCSSPNPYPKLPPMTIVHTSISNAPSSSIYLDNFLQAQQFPSNFDLTQSQSNLSQSINVSENASSTKVYSQNMNKSVRSARAKKNTGKACDDSDNHKFKTPDKPVTNLSCFGNIVLKKSPSMIEEETTGIKSGEKGSDPKEKLVSNKPSSSSKSKNDRQLSEDMSQMSYVSIAPQNIPSEIELTQTSSINVTNQKQKERLETISSPKKSAKCMENTKKVSFQSKSNKEKKKSSEDTLESGLSMVVCLSQSSDENNKTSMNLEKSKNIEEKIKNEQHLKMKKIFDLSPPSPEQSRNKDKPGIDEEGVEKQADATIETHSLDESSDVELLEESIQEDFGVALTVEISSYNNNMVENNKEHNREDDISNTSRVIAQKQAEVARNNDSFSNGSVGGSGIIGVEVSNDKGLSIDIKTKEESEHVELEDNECNVAENANSSVENVLSLNDSSDVELIEESEEDNDVSVDGASSLSQNSSIIDNLSKSMRDIEGENIQVTSKFKNNLCEEGSFGTERTVGDNLYPKGPTQTNAPIYHVFVSDTNTFEVINSNEVEVKTFGKVDLQLENDENIEETVKACKVRIPKLNLLKTAEKHHCNIGGLIAQPPVEGQTSVRESERAASIEQKHGNIVGLVTQKSPEEVQTKLKETSKSVNAYEGVVLETKQNFQASNTVACHKRRNLVIQSPKEVNLHEKQSTIEEIPLKYAKSNDFDTNENSTEHNLDDKFKKDQCRKELNTLQKQSFDGSTKSNSKESPKDIQISKETSKNPSSGVPKNVAVKISPSFKSQNSRNTTLATDNSPINFSLNDFQPAAQSSTKQKIDFNKSKNQPNIIEKDVLDAHTVEHSKSSDNNESPVSGKHKTHVHTSPTKSSQDKTEISEKSKDTADEYVLPDSSESFPGPSQATINSEVGIQHVVVFKATDEIVAAAKNTSEHETYSETFGKAGDTSAIAIATSTQLSNQKEKDKENSIADETSVESIDLSCCFISSDDDSSNANDGNTNEDKLSHSVNIRSILKSNSKPSLEPIQTTPEETSKNRDIKVEKDVEMTPIESQNLGNATIATDHSYANDSNDVEDNDLQLAAEKSLTNQMIDDSDKNKNQPSLINQKDVLDAPTVQNYCKSSENSKVSSTRSPQTHPHDFSKNIVETTLPTKTLEDKNDKISYSIREKANKTIDKYVIPSFTESFSRLSSATYKLNNASEHLDANSKDELQQHVVETFPANSQVSNKAKYISAGGTYSQSFEKTDTPNTIAITTSTQVEIPVCEEKVNEQEYNISAETSGSSSVELIDLHYISSDDDNNYNENDDNNREMKFSLTKHFTELSIFKKKIADTSEIVNEELLDNSNEGALPVNIPSTLNISTTIPKDSEDLRPTLDSKIFLNTNETERSPNDEVAICENKTSNDSPVFEVFDTRDFGKMRKLLQDFVDQVLNDKENTPKDKQSRNSQNKENLQLSPEFDQNITPDLNIGCVLHDYNSQPAINSPLIDEQLSNQSISPLQRNQCNLTKNSKNMQEAIEEVMKIKKNLNRIVRRRSTFDQEEQMQQPDSNSARTTYSLSQPPEVYCPKVVAQKSSKFDQQRFPHLKIQTFNDLTVPLIHSEVHDPDVPQTSPKSDSHLLPQELAQGATTKNPSNNSEPTISKKMKTITLQGFIPIATLQQIQTSNENIVEVPIMIGRPLNTLPLMTALSELIQRNLTQRMDAFRVRMELKLDEHELQPVHAEVPIPMSRAEPKSPIIHEVNRDKKVPTKSVNAEPKNHPQKNSIQLGCKTKTKIPTTSKKKTTPKKSSKLPDFVQQKIHAFPSIPLKPCSKPPKNKPPSLLTVEECDYLIEDASQPIAATTTDASQILGTDCTYFENSELLRNLDEICIPPHHPEEPKEPIEQQPPRVPSSSTQPPPAASKVINLIPITLSEGVTARKVWQVNLKWKSQKEMSIEVRFSVNKRSMTVCDESAKLLFNFTPQIWSDIHRVIREIDHFEYKRITLRNQCKTTPLHKVLRQLFNSSSQVVDVKLINDHYNPYTICEKTIPVCRKPFQCLTKGIAPDILSKMSFLKQNLQNNNQL